MMVRFVSNISLRMHSKTWVLTNMYRTPKTRRNERRRCSNWGYYRPGHCSYSAGKVNHRSSNTSAVEAATEQIIANVRREMGVIEDVGMKLCSLQVENQKLTFEIDRLKQYRRRENVRFYGLADIQVEITNTVFIDMARDIGVTITPADISVSHRPRRPGGSSDAKPRPLIVKLVRRDNKIELMRNKKKMRR